MTRERRVLEIEGLKIRTEIDGGGSQKWPRPT